MPLLLCFALILLAAVLLSSLANRTILSTAVLFLVAGFVLGEGVTGVVPLTPSDPSVKLLAELALFAVLFTDGMKVGWPQLRTAWRLPGRALGWGMPLTLVITALAAHFIVGLGWPESLLIGAVLAPTDPVFASALVGNDKVPPRLRHLLNVESGVNDGIALPFVMVFLAISAGSGDLGLGALGLELLLGLVIGLAVPWLALRLERLRFFSASTQYEPLNALAIGIVVLALAQAVHGNLFIAAFTAGITVATFGSRQRQAFEHFGELIAELLKLAALLVFGVLISPAFLAEISWAGWLFVVVAIFVARPVALWFSFLGARLNLREQAAAMWFGPKGFASVVYGLIVLKSGIAGADLLFHLIAGTIVVSILLHSSTDVVVARWLDDAAETPAWHRRLRRFTGTDRSEPSGGEKAHAARS
ncbi:cation:proton antiporter [Stackebrandtia soli]|uniref:cation:proton antiporter n=1 Tax=Stackebrandtia soli TaxID=1892856 RepID=UPI0039EA6EA4